MLLSPNITGIYLKNIKAPLFWTKFQLEAGFFTSEAAALVDQTSHFQTNYEVAREII